MYYDPSNVKQYTTSFGSHCQISKSGVLSASLVSSDKVYLSNDGMSLCIVNIASFSVLGQ